LHKFCTETAIKIVFYFIIGGGMFRLGADGFGFDFLIGGVKSLPGL
jgi:hypothetical protein